MNESKAIFKELKKQYLRFKYSWFPSNYKRGVVHEYFLDYTQIEAQTLNDMLIQHLDSIEKTIDESVLHRRADDDMVNEEKLQIQEEQAITVQTLEANLVVTESSGTTSDKQDDNNRSGNDTEADCADIMPTCDTEPNFDEE